MRKTPSRVLHKSLDYSAITEVIVSGAGAGDKHLFPGSVFLVSFGLKKMNRPVPDNEKFFSSTKES